MPICVVNFSLNLPGPLAGHHLANIGCEVIKVEPTQGEPFMERLFPIWYRRIHEKQKVLRFNVKEESEKFHELLARAEVLLTGFRPAALKRLGLEWSSLQKRHPGLSLVSITGFSNPWEDMPGHDVLYQARSGTLQPPDLPPLLLADYVSAERAAQLVLTAALRFKLEGKVQHFTVCMDQVLKSYLDPLLYGVTARGGILRGENPFYRIYLCQRGWVALGALEEEFVEIFKRELQMKNPLDLVKIFKQKTAEDWEAWALKSGLPLVAVRNEKGELYGS